MELDGRNFSRLFSILKHHIHMRWQNYIKLALAYIFILGGYTFILWYYKTSLDDCSWPLGAMSVVVITIVMSLVYIAINHLIVQRLICHRALFLIEFALIISLTII